MAPQFDSTNPGLSFAKELEVSSILKQCRICGTLGFKDNWSWLDSQVPRALHFPRNTHDSRFQVEKFSPPISWAIWILFLGMFVGMSVILGLWIISAIHSSRVSSYPFVSAKLGVAFRSIWRDMINVKMGWLPYLPKYPIILMFHDFFDLEHKYCSQFTAIQPSQPHAISSAAGASPRAVVKVRVIRAQSTWSLEKVGYNCCNLCSTYTPGNPHIPPLEKEIIFKIAFSGDMTVSGSVSEYLQEKLLKFSKVGFWVAACLFLMIGIPHTGYPIKTHHEVKNSRWSQTH